MSKILSIVIPNYNGVEFLHSCLQSVFAQVRDDCEIVLVDDGSTDGTGEIIDKIDFPVDVRYHWQQNAGDAAARNSLIGHCSWPQL